MMDREMKIEELDTSNPEDLAHAIRIWNKVVSDGSAFPQTEPLDDETGRAFFDSQTRTAVARLDHQIVGLYILHPNNVGRCSHIANASYAVSEEARGSGVGRALVEDSIVQAGISGFTGLQFNAVVASNAGAIHLYEKIGFTRIGMIPNGFRNLDGDLEDIFIFYIDTPSA